ncbi:hypothetical protein FRC09_010067, partial [Ceratobasidium sp. 395]
PFWARGASGGSAITTASTSQHRAKSCGGIGRKAGGRRAEGGRKAGGRRAEGGRKAGGRRAEDGRVWLGGVRGCRMLSWSEGA